MLTAPNLKDEEIIACLRDAYGLTVEKITFLPIGAKKIISSVSNNMSQKL